MVGPLVSSTPRDLERLTLHLKIRLRSELRGVPSRAVIGGYQGSVAHWWAKPAKARLRDGVLGLFAAACLVMLVAVPIFEGSEESTPKRDPGFCDTAFTDPVTQGAQADLCSEEGR